MASFLLRGVSALLAGLLVIAQPGPCPCWLFTLWRIEASAAAPVVIDAHAGHEGHADHDLSATLRINALSSEIPLGQSAADPLRFGVQIPPIPVLVSSLLARLALRSIHWRVLCQDVSQPLTWRPALDPPPPRLAL
ncbi:MAG TPA: hypothetical protein PLC98_03200 [Anaerolineales bacterium]|nr:hypothetical protein [Anaerolineales bacterium]